MCENGMTLAGVESCISQLTASLQEQRSETAYKCLFLSGTCECGFTYSALRICDVSLSPPIDLSRSVRLKNLCFMLCSEKNSKRDEISVNAVL